MVSIAEKPAGVNYNHTVDGNNNHVEVAPKAIKRRYEAPPVPAHMIMGEPIAPCSPTPRFTPVPQSPRLPTAQELEELPSFFANLKLTDEQITRLFALSDRELPPIVSLADMEEQKLEEPPELIGGLLHQGEKMVISGTSKSFKTWSLIDLGLSVAAGREWWGRNTSTGMVLYINFEIQPFYMRSRSVKVAEAKGITKEERRNFQMWNLRGHAADFAILRDKIAVTAGSIYKLIIIDPVYKGLGDRDENKAGDIARLLNEFEKLAMMTGAAVVFGHHYSKGNQAAKDPMDRMGGSGVFARDPDTLISVTKHEQEDAYTVECQTRNFVRPEPFCIKWEFPLMVPDGTLNPAKLKEAGKKKKIYDETETLKILGLQTLTFTDWFDQVKNKTGMSENTFTAHKKSLEKLNKVEKTKGSCYIATTAATAI